MTYTALIKCTPSLMALCLSLCFGGVLNSQTPNNYPVVSLCDLDLNRTATKLSPAQLVTVSPANKGFIWNTGDNETDKFRPQGVTDITLGCRKYIGVSWYGRSSENYENRGARVSLVDISDMDNIQYRHILLVDENYNTFNDIHAGGLLYKNDTLYIPDTRSGSGKRIYGFALNDIKRVPDTDLSTFYDYRYIVKRVVTRHLPIQSSTISYDWDSDEMLIATFKNLCNTCNFNPETTFSWFGINNVTSSAPFHINFFDKAQGMASIDNPLNPSKKLMWTASSYGRNNPSYIYATEFDRSPNNTSGQLVDTNDLNYTAYEFPPGLENLHFEQDKKTLWTITEFTPNEGTGNNRMVFSFDRNDIMPPTSSVQLNAEEELKAIRIYPNPAKNSFYIDLGEENHAIVNIYNSVGTLIMTKSIDQKTSFIEGIESSGYYMVEIRIEGRVIRKKLLTN